MARALLLLTLIFLEGCKGVQTKKERLSRDQLQRIEQAYWPEFEASPLPPSPGLSNYLQFAILNHPSIKAAYFDWASSVDRITVERSMPDPKLTFQAYITDVITSLMPGLMQDFPGPGKLKAAGNVAAEESRSKYFAFETSVFQTALSVKQAYYQLWFLDENIQINRRTLSLLTDLESIARSRNEVGQVTLQDVYRAQIERDKLATDLESLEDSRRPLTAQFKAALGLKREQSAPPMPGKFESTPVNLNGENLLDIAFQRNPKLRGMEADVRLAEANIAMARKSKVPDFSAGLQAEVYEPPFYWPQASMTLPVWRDKIASKISAAQANKRAAEARLSAEQISLTVDFAMKTYDFRETTRNLELLQKNLIPKSLKSLEIARAGYLSGKLDFLNLLDAQRTLLNFQMEEIAAKSRREMLLAELSLSIAGIPPEGNTILPTTPTKF
jgi:outer membrane protein TolC